MNLGLEGRTAIVTGSSAGLGRATAAAFAREGASVVMNSRDLERIEYAAEEIRNEYDAEVLAVEADLSKKDDAEKLVSTAVDKYGRIDVLFTNTGGPPPGFFPDFSDDDWQAAFESQLLYVVRLVRLVLPHMQKRGWGRIINDTSISVREPIDNLLLSNVFRAGVVALSKTLSRQVAKDGILVNCVAPGFTDTARVKNLMQARADAARTTPEKIMEGIVSGIPIGRICTPEEFAEAVVFLASENASGINGSILCIDGGTLRGI